MTLKYFEIFFLFVSNIFLLAFSSTQPQLPIGKMLALPPAVKDEDEILPCSIHFMLGKKSHPLSFIGNGVLIRSDMVITTRSVIILYEKNRAEAKLYAYAADSSTGTDISKVIHAYVKNDSDIAIAKVTSSSYNNSKFYN